MKTAFINFGGAVGCTIYAVAYLVAKLTTGEVANAPEPLGVKIFRWTMVLGVVKLGIILAVVLTDFPWRTFTLLVPLIALTSLFVGDFLDGLLLGGITSLVFLAAAGATRLCMYLARGREPT
jgi:hypothetical protein